MKSRIFILILASHLIVSVSSAQQDSMIPPKSIFSMERMNVIFMGIENPISIALEGVAQEDIIAEASIGRLSGKNGEYSFYISDTVKPVHPIVEIKVFVKQQDRVKYIDSKVFRLRHIPQPTAYYGSRANNAYEFRIVNYISVRLGDFPYDLKFKVTRFQFIYNPVNGKPKIYESNGPSLTQQMKSSLSNPQKGDQVIITNIWYDATGLKERCINGSIVITVK